MKPLLVAIAATTLPCFAAPVALGQDISYTFEGEEILADQVSGVTTGDTVRLVASPSATPWWRGLPPPLNSDQYWDVPLDNAVQEGVQDIVAREKSDEPCDIEIKFRNINGPQGFINGSGLMRDCGGNDNRGNKSSEQDVTISPDIDLSGLTDQQTSEVPEELRDLLDAAVATSVQICLNKTKMKGLVLNGSRAFCQTRVGLDLEFCQRDRPSPDLPRRFTPANFFERPNCPGNNAGQVDSDWQTVPSVCPDVETVVQIGQQTRTLITGTGMVGVELHLTRQGQKKYVSGIRAICKRVVLDGFRSQTSGSTDRRQPVLLKPQKN